MNTATNIPEKHLLVKRPEKLLKTVKIIKEVTKIDILFINYIFRKLIWYNGINLFTDKK